MRGKYLLIGSQKFWKINSFSFALMFKKRNGSHTGLKINTRGGSGTGGSRISGTGFFFISLVCQE
jgi:hypothetical protein